MHYFYALIFWIKNILHIQTVFLFFNKSLKSFHSSPIYPTANNSYNPSNGQITPHDQQHQYYKTTIPVNATQCQCSAAKAVKETADSQQQLARTAANNNKKNNDVISGTHCGIPSQQKHSCCCVTQPATTTLTNIETEPMRSSQANKNHTTTKTTIEYELSNGIAKLCKISTSRIAAEHLSLPLPSEFSESAERKSSLSSPLKNSNLVLPPLLSSAELEDINQNLNTINAFNRNSKASSSLNNQYGAFFGQQKANYSMDCNKPNGNEQSFLDCAQRDRLGLAGTTGDSDAPGSVSGLDRLNKKKYNKVSVVNFKSFQGDMKKKN